VRSIVSVVGIGRIVVAVVFWVAGLGRCVADQRVH
jgi:hypothetical protein